MDSIGKNESVEIYQRHLIKQLLNSDEVLRDYIKTQDTISKETIGDLYGLYNTIKSKKMMIVVGKNVVKSLLITTKSSMMETDLSNVSGIKGKLIKNVKPFLTFIHPENITPELASDEYVALVNSVVNSNKKGSTNVYIVVAHNILMSLVSSNLTTLLSSLTNNGNGEGSSKLTEDEFSSLYNKIDVGKRKRDHESDNNDDDDGSESKRSKEDLDDISIVTPIYSFEDLLNREPSEPYNDEDIKETNNIIEEPKEVEISDAISNTSPEVDDDDKEDQKILDDDLFLIFKKSSEVINENITKTDNNNDDDEDLSAIVPKNNPEEETRNNEELEREGIENLFKSLNEEDKDEEDEEECENNNGLIYDTNENQEMETSDISEANRLKIDRMLMEYKKNAKSINSNKKLNKYKVDLSFT
ncbi:hypothetical protein PmNV_099 [Penaeus monodon nudivirus]|uniref:Uncharacterized protein n=1 Tax=Penaeus monodon nudivirus TaxID=1529056 RepID=A0A076FCD5_9VIRU|nr:hypothetical protein PmNV_099 [Penaeus monodon nudivirus]AII15887.1 hypothetical protein PmNV_099 [Penaeus monodon nudivirus]